MRFSGREKGGSRAQGAMARAAALCAVFIATVLLALLTFVSLKLAALVFLIAAAGILLYAESRRRGFQALAYSFKFKALRDGLDALREEMRRNAHGLAALRGDLEETRARIVGMKQAAPPEKKAGRGFADLSSAILPSNDRSSSGGVSAGQSSSDLPSALPPDFYDRAGMDAESVKWVLRRQPHAPDIAPDFPAEEMSAMPRALRPGQAGSGSGADPAREAAAEDQGIPLPPQEEGRGEDAEDFSDAVVRELLRHAVGSRRIEAFVQPVMRLPQRQVRFYEVFARIRARPGEYIPAARYMKLAELDNLHREIDVLLLLHCLKTIQDSARVERAAPFFLNITRETLGNGPFMRQLLGFLSRNRHLAPRIIFEIPQAQFADLPPPLLEIVRGLGRLGCSFSLDHALSLDLDIADLQKLKVRFVKIDAARLLAAGGREREAALINRARRRLEANGIGVIAQRVESEAQLRQLLDIDLHYGQGFLFGRPEPQGAYADRNRARRRGAEEQKQA